MDNDVGITNKSAREKQRIEIEKKRKKAAKKKERLAAMDAAGERQKKSWQSFNNKVIKKKKAGVVSIDNEKSISSHTQIRPITLF